MKTGNPIHWRSRKHARKLELRRFTQQLPSTTWQDAESVTNIRREIEKRKHEVERAAA